MRTLGFPVTATLAALALAACGAPEPAGPPIALLSPDSANHQSSQFSPDGSRVAWWAATPEGWDLMVAGADLANPRKLASSPDQPEGPIWSPDGATLAFWSAATSTADVWIVGADGSGLRQVTDAPGLEWPMQWHPSGDRFSYLATAAGGTYRVMVFHLGTGVSTPLLPAETRPAIGYWSPDGSRIGIGVFDRGAFTLWVADSAGGNARQLTTEGQEGFECCSNPWSPDGRELAYTSRRTGKGDIWVVPVDSGPARQLTTDVREDNQASWSSDGKWVAFRSERGQQTDLWVVAAAGGEAIRVTDDTQEESGPRWMPGRPVVTYHTGTTLRSLWAHDLADGAERRLTADSIRPGGMDVSPDGSQLVYEVVRGGGVTDLVVASVADGAARVLVANSSLNIEPYWSPDGRQIAFQSTRTGNRDVYLVDAAGGEPRQLTDWPTDETDAEWGGDGTLYFLSSRDASPFSDLWRIPPGGGEPVRMTRLGNVTNIEPSRGLPDVYSYTIGTRAGELLMGRITDQGKLEPMWTQGSVLNFGHRTISPKGDSVAMGVEMADRSRAVVLVSRTGKFGRVLIPGTERLGPFSPDGRQMIHFLGRPTASDLAALSLDDGSVRRLTTTPESEESVQWAQGGATVVFARAVVRRQIATAEVGGLLRPAP